MFRLFQIQFPKINKSLFATICIVLIAMIGSGCASDQKNTAKGAGIGAAAGALAGAIIGHQTGKRNEGVLIGAALGASMGGYVGHRMDKQAKELEKIAETKRTEHGLITKLKSDILFDSGKSELKPEAKQNLSKMADIMKKYPENVLTVKGYTDSTGSASINQTLSQKRAEAVRSQLVTNGLPTQTVAAKGLGPAEPIGDNTTADGRKTNRRVEIEVTVDESKVPKEK